MEVDGDVRSLIGHVVDEPYSSFTMTMEGTSVLAKIHISPYLYVIEDKPALGGHIMKQIDKRRIPAAPYIDDAPPIDKEPAEKVESASDSSPDSELPGAKAGVSKSLPDNGNVRVLFLYTPDVQSSNNINTLTANIISEFNSTLANSVIAPEYYLTRAGTRIVDDNFDDRCLESIRGDFVIGRDPFGNVENQLDNLDADMAILIITTEPPDPDKCWTTWGRIGGIAVIFDKDDPWAITTDTWATGDLTAIHEAGHVMGGHHADHTSGKPGGIPNEAEGWEINDSDPFQTIMGNYSICPDVDPNNPPTNQDCERIPYWSDPNRPINGEWIGDNDSDMTGSLPDTGSQDGTMGEDGAGTVTGVAGWDQYSYSRPGTPSGLTIQNEQCYGLHEVSWPSVSNTQQYQLLRSTSSSFTNSVMIHSGTSTTTFVTVDSGTWYLRVRACNGSGCSGHSVQRSASYYPGCQ